MLVILCILATSIWTCWTILGLMVLSNREQKMQAMSTKILERNSG